MITKMDLIQFIVIFYVLGTALFFILTNSIMFHPPHPTIFHDDSTTIKLALPNGNSLSAIYLPNPQAKYTILISHGNAEDLGYLMPFLRYFQQQGYAIFCYDYEGYGTSTGKPTEKNTYQDITVAYHYLTENLKISPQQIILFGRSLGVGPTVYLASLYPAAGIILESPFVSAYRVMTNIPLFFFDKYPNLSRIKQISIPALVIHGTKDTIIPIWHGKKIFEEIKGKKKSFWVEGADHNDILDVAKDSYWQTINHFISNLK